MERTTWPVYSLGKRNVLGYIWMSPERVSVREEGEGHSMLTDWRHKKRGNQQWSLMWGRKQSGEYGSVCKVEDSHRDKMEQRVWHIYSSQCLSCTEFLASWQHLHGIGNVFAAWIYWSKMQVMFPIHMHADTTFNMNTAAELPYTHKVQHEHSGRASIQTHKYQVQHEHTGRASI